MFAERMYLRTSQVASLLGCSKQYVSKLIRDGKLASHQISKKGWHRVSVRSLLAYAGSEQIYIDLGALDKDDSTP